MKFDMPLNKETKKKDFLSWNKNSPYTSVGISVLHFLLYIFNDNISHAIWVP